MQQLFGVLEENWPIFLLAALLFAVSFVWLSFLARTRERTKKELERLYSSNLPAYLERLENNRMLPLVYRKSTVLLMQLDGYMAAGEDEKAVGVIGLLDKIHIEPQEKVEFYQKRLSFYISILDEAHSRESLAKLEEYLNKVKAQDVPKYAEMLDEAKSLIRVYIERDTNYIGALQQKAAKTKHPVVRGITQYRIAKLAYFKGDMETCRKYLERASGNLGGTYYEAIIRQAQENPVILEKK